MAKRNRKKLLTEAQMMAARQELDMRAMRRTGELALIEAEQRADIRAAVLQRSVQSAGVTIKDLIEFNDDHQVSLRDVSTLPDHVARVVRKLKIRRTTYNPKEGEPRTETTIEVELAHHLDYDANLAKLLTLNPRENTDGDARTVHNHLHLKDITLDEMRGMDPEKLRAIRLSLEREINEASE